jgi:hypothetical protein
MWLFHYFLHKVKTADSYFEKYVKSKTFNSQIIFITLYYGGFSDLQGLIHNHCSCILLIGGDATTTIHLLYSSFYGLQLAATEAGYNGWRGVTKQQIF